MPTNTHERVPYSFEQIALDNHDPRLTSHPQSERAVKQYESLQNPSLDGVDIPSLSLLSQLPYLRYHQKIRSFLQLCTLTEGARQRELGFPFFYVASPELEKKIKKTASMLSKPFVVKEQHRSGNSVQLISELGNKRNFFIPQVQIIMDAELRENGVIRIVNLELQKKTRGDVSKKSLLPYQIEVLVDPSFEENGHLPYYNQLFLSDIPSSLYQIVVMRHELGHVATPESQPIDRILGVQKMKFMETYGKNSHSLEDEEKCTKELIHHLGMFSKNWKALLEPLSVREATAIYADEVAASVQAEKFMGEVISFFGLEHTNLLQEINLFLADVLSSYLLAIGKFIGKSILPQTYQRLTEEEIKKLPLLRKMLGLSLAR